MTPVTSTVRDFGSYLLWRSRIADLARSLLTQRGRFALTFHGIGSSHYPDLPWQVQPHLTMDQLRATLVWLRERFDLLTPEEFLHGRGGGVLLTFDDGFANNHTCALPVLRELEAPAVFFVSTQHVEDPRAWLPATRVLVRSHWPDADSVPRDLAAELFDGMSRDQLRECASDPLITIGVHTHSHPLLTACDDGQLFYELSHARGLLEGWTGEPVGLFAYPTGDYDLRVTQAVESSGFIAAFAQDTKRITATRFEIPRVGIHHARLSYLSLKLSGLHKAALKTAPVP